MYSVKWLIFNYIKLFCSPFAYQMHTICIYCTYNTITIWFKLAGYDQFV